MPDLADRAEKARECDLCYALQWATGKFKICQECNKFTDGIEKAEEN